MQIFLKTFDAKDRILPRAFPNRSIQRVMMKSRHGLKRLQFPPILRNHFKMLKDARRFSSCCPVAPTVQTFVLVGVEADSSSPNVAIQTFSRPFSIKKCSRLVVKFRPRSHDVFFSQLRQKFRVTLKNDDDSIFFEAFEWFTNVKRNDCCPR